MPQLLRPHTIGKITRPKGGVEWNEITTQLVLELLSHRTPPSCIPANIVSVAKIILPNYNVITEVPSIEFIRSSRGTLSYFTKLLASYELAKAPVFIGHHTDGTNRRGIEFQNNILRIAKDGGFKNVTLDSCIVTPNATSVMIRDGVLQSFQTGRVILQRWRTLVSELYPGRQDLLDQIPLPKELSLAKLASGGWSLTDTCNPARAFRKLFIASVRQIAEEEGVSLEEIRVWEAGEKVVYHCMHVYHCVNSQLL